jgi:hypothetical protein
VNVYRILEQRETHEWDFLSTGHHSLLPESTNDLARSSRNVPYEGDHVTSLSTGPGVPVQLTYLNLSEQELELLAARRRSLTIFGDPGKSFA